MFLKIYKKIRKKPLKFKPKRKNMPMLEKVMVYDEIIDCSKYYIVHNYKTNKREIVMKGESLMTEEEKKAIEAVKNIIEEVADNTKQEIPTYIFDRDIKCLPIVLNLITKQQKEIENSVSKDKIRELRNEDNIDYVQFKLKELLEE